VSEQQQRLRTNDLANTPPAREQSEPDAEIGQPGETPHPPESPAASEQTPLMAPEEAEDYRRRWDAIQTHFVDSPRDAVGEADELVAQVMRHLAETFSRARKDLEKSWEHGQDISTEDLRVSLQRYRCFFNRLLGT
jgi:hypothetical protein